MGIAVGGNDTHRGLGELKQANLSQPIRNEVVMKISLAFKAAIVVPSILASLGCNGSAGPTGPTEIESSATIVAPPVPVPAPSPLGAGLADQIQGTFKGMFQNPSLPTAINDYSIIITKLSDTSVRVSPVAGGISSTFEANLSSQVSGSVTSVILKAPSDILGNNGTFVFATGRLAYAYHLGGSDDGNVEVFSGIKQ